jgi:hypothetical protein
VSDATTDIATWADGVVSDARTKHGDGKICVCWRLPSASSDHKTAHSEPHWHAVLGCELDRDNSSKFAAIYCTRAHAPAPAPIDALLAGARRIEPGVRPAAATDAHLAVDPMPMQLVPRAKPAISGLLHDLKSALAGESLLLASMSQVSNDQSLFTEVLQMLSKSNAHCSERVQLLQYLTAAQDAATPNAKHSLSIALSVLPQELRETVATELHGDPGSGAAIDAPSLFRSLASVATWNFSSATRKRGGRAVARGVVEGVIEFAFTSACDEDPWSKVLNGLGIDQPNRRGSRTDGTIAEAIIAGAPLWCLVHDGHCESCVTLPKRQGLA